MGLDTFAPMLQWQPEMKGNLLRVVLPTTEASGRSFAPSARRVGVDDQRRDACRRAGVYWLQALQDWCLSMTAAKQVQHNHNSGGIASWQKAQYPNETYTKRSPMSFTFTVTEDSSDEMIISSYTFFSNESILHSVPGEAVGVGAESVLPASIVENECVPGKLAVKRPPHLVLGDVVTVRSGDDSLRIDDSIDKSDALVSASGFDFAGLIIGLGHFGPPFIC